MSETASAKLFKTFKSDLSSKELQVEIDHHNLFTSFHFEIYFANKCAHIYMKIVCENDGCDPAFYNASTKNMNQIDEEKKMKWRSNGGCTSTNEANTASTGK